MKSKSKTSQKVTKILTAAAGGVASNFAVQMADKIPAVANMDPKIKKAVPLILAFFAMDFSEPLALGMAGSSGANVAHEFGIGDLGELSEDDLSGLEFVDIEGTEYSGVGESYSGVGAFED